MADRGDEFGKGSNQPGQCVNQKCEIDNSHGFLLIFVGLDWPDVNEAESRESITGKAACAALAGRCCTS